MNIMNIMSNSHHINFAITGLPVVESIYMLAIDEQVNLFNYLVQLNEIQKKTYMIAFNHLGTSFNIYRSNGYKEWINKQK